MLICLDPSHMSFGLLGGQKQLFGAFERNAYDNYHTRHLAKAWDLLGLDWGLLWYITLIRGHTHIFSNV